MFIPLFSLKKGGMGFLILKKGIFPGKQDPWPRRGGICGKTVEFEGGGG